MLSLIISGCAGHMGRSVAALAGADPELYICGGITRSGGGAYPFPVFPSPARCPQGDVLVDFSHPDALPGLLTWALEKRRPLVLATTGYTQTQLEQISAAAAQVPIFRSANMSLGVSVLLELVRQAAAALGEHFDVEVIERHHRRKTDAPSGTALMLAQAAARALPRESQYTYERRSLHRPRDPREIGISSIRGGTIVGDHQVLFAGQDEVLELTHRASSREVYASGALQAAKFIAGKGPGLYSMSHLVRQHRIQGQ